PTDSRCCCADLPPGRETTAHAANCRRWSALQRLTASSDECRRTWRMFPALSSLGLPSLALPMARSMPCQAIPAHWRELSLGSPPLAKIHWLEPSLVPGLPEPVPVPPIRSPALLPPLAAASVLAAAIRSRSPLLPTSAIL